MTRSANARVGILGSAASGRARAPQRKARSMPVDSFSSAKASKAERDCGSRRLAASSGSVLRSDSFSEAVTLALATSDVVACSGAHLATISSAGAESACWRSRFHLLKTE
eukprot:scaffold312846_cov30-Tisochrysis_lutea.AAC.3